MLNRSILQGRLVADPEMRTTQSGTAVCGFKIAWSEKYKETENKCFMPCSAWRGTAEFVEKYFTKGQEIIVEGQLLTKEWQDKEGNKRSSIEMTVDKAHFCGPKKDGGFSSAYEPSTSAPEFAPLENAKDLPF